MGNRISKTDEALTRWDYAYDNLYRLSQVDQTANCRFCLPHPVEKYPGYDGVGNRYATATKPWTYSDRNELLSGPGKLTYDLNGNLATKIEGADTWTYEWSVENQLTRVVKNGAEVASFLYDPLGRRVQKIAGGVTRKFAYDGEDILRERVPGVTYRYIHGPGIDEPLGVENITTAVMTYYHADGLGSIVKTTNASGAVTLTRTYDSFGIPVLGADQPGYAYTAREWDPETGLYYYRARYYDPKVGRFISEDPIGWYGGLNLYGYVGNNAVRWVDPFGLKAGDKYANKNQAAKAAMRDIFPPANVEYCGNICPMSGGMTYDPPKTDNDPGGCKPEPKCSNGAAASAMYHSHPPGFDPILSTYFSGDDSLTAGCMGFGSCQPVYMVCYTGQMQKLRPDATHRTIGWIR